MTKSIKNDIYFLKYVFEFSPSYVIGEAIVAIVNGLMPLPAPRLNTGLCGIAVCRLFYNRIYNRTLY